MTVNGFALDIMVIGGGLLIACIGVLVARHIATADARERPRRRS